MTRLEDGAPEAAWPFRAAILFILVLNFSAGSLQRAAASGTEVLNIGALLPPEEPQLQSLREGILLAQEQANQGTNSPVRVIIRGRVGQWGADAVEAARLVTDEGAAGLIAPPDGAASHLVLQVSGRTAVPVVTLCADSSVGHTGVPWLLRMVPCTEQEAAALFHGMFPTNSGRGRRWVALVPSQRAGREIARDLRKAALACDCEFGRALEVNSATNTDQICAQALSAKPEAILLWLPPSSAGILAAGLRGLGYQGPLGGPGRLQSSDFFSQAGSAAHGFFVPGIVPNSDTIALRNAFDRAYESRWGHSPDTMAAASYDAVLVLAQMLRQDKFERPPHRLPAGFCWAGVSGDVRFDADGNRKVQLKLLRGRGGRFVAENPPR